MASFYIASKFENKEQVQLLMRELRKLGHSISYDWTQQHPTDDIMVQYEQALLDFKGVMAAQVLVVLFGIEPINDTINRYVEMGIGLGAGKKVCVVGPPDSGCIFVGLPQVQFYESMPLFLVLLEAGEVL